MITNRRKKRLPPPLPVVDDQPSFRRRVRVSRTRCCGTRVRRRRWIGSLLGIAWTVYIVLDMRIRRIRKLRRERHEAVAAAASAVGVTEATLREIQRRLQIQHEVNLEPCRWLTIRNDTENQQVEALCKRRKQTLYVYNPWLKHERYLCDGTKIGPGSSVVASLSCADPPTLVRVNPNPDAKGMPPVVLRFENSRENGELLEGCDVPCMNYGHWDRLSTTKTVDVMDGSAWSFTYSMEGEQFYPELKIDPIGWKTNKFWATTSYQSDVPLSYYSGAKYETLRKMPAVKFDSAFKGAAVLSRQCASQNNREQRILELIASVFRVDCLNPCPCVQDNVAESPFRVVSGGQKRIRVIQHYLFYLAFENQCTNDYVTDKLWEAFEAGAVPVYYGAPNIKDFVPEDSIIDVNDYADTAQLVEDLIKATKDKKFYESYHSWRKKPLPPHFHTRYDFANTNDTCRMCRWAYARQYGLGWNHTSQTLRNLVSGPRQVCLNSDGLIVHPFHESWLTKEGATATAVHNADDSTSGYPCTITDGNRVLLIDHGRLRRLVRFHDGVVDLYFENNKFASAVLHLKTPLSKRDVTPLKEVRKGVWRMQDNHTRFTLLTLPRLSKMSAVSGTVIVEIPVALTQLRVIVEDIDSFHAGAEQVENFFGKFMAEDLFNPLEFFIPTEEMAISAQ